MDALTLTTAYEIIRQPLGEILPKVSAALAPLIPHADAAELSTHCAHSPFKTLGGTELMTAAELTPLLAAGVPGEPWQGSATIGGREREVVAVTSHATRRGAVLVLVREDGAAPPTRPRSPWRRRCGTWSPGTSTASRRRPCRARWRVRGRRPTHARA
ncbi:hypothetical protein O1L60_16990 [Streptomyces diastatochromogenes]|nr:hypothetical protein [Streptomyces diastatochromogenes]